MLLLENIFSHLHVQLCLQIMFSHIQTSDKLDGFHTLIWHPIYWTSVPYNGKHSIWYTRNGSKRLITWYLHIMCQLLCRQNRVCTHTTDLYLPKIWSLHKIKISSSNHISFLTSTLTAKLCRIGKKKTQKHWDFLSEMCPLYNLGWRPQ